MRNTCSMCKRNYCHVKQLDNDFYCSNCLDNYRCLKCNSLYDGCAFCCKLICECVEYKVEYDYAGNVMMCLPCFEKQDGETQLYKYFKEKYNEPLTLVDIQK